MVKFEPADGSTMKLCQQLTQKLHKPLHEAKVKIDVGFAIAEEEEPAVKEGGYSVFGKVSFTSAQQRAHGSPDVRQTLDKGDWENADVDHREAMLDHLLTQIDLRTNAKSGEVITDSAGRPKLKRHKYDMRLQEFSTVVEEHGQAAPGYGAVAKIKEQFGQLLLFTENPAAVG